MSQQEPFLQQIRDTSNTTLDVLLTNLQTNISTAYGQANTATAAAAGALTVAEQAYAAGNSGIIIGEGAYAEANNAYTVGASAYGLASTAVSIGEGAWATANVGISASGVTAGSYGGGQAIPNFTVDARGRVTAVSTTSYAQFSPSSAGIVPASGGGTTNFQRADGAWAPPLAVIAATLASNGSMTLGTTAGQVKVQWGIYTATIPGSAGPFTFNFPSSFSGTPYVVVPIAIGGEIAFALGTTSSTQFSIYSSFASSASTHVGFFAIGPA